MIWVECYGSIDVHDGCWRQLNVVTNDVVTNITVAVVIRGITGFLQTYIFGFRYIILRWLPVLYDMYFQQRAKISNTRTGLKFFHHSSPKSLHKHVKNSIKVIKRHIASSRHRTISDNNRDKIRIVEPNLATDVSRIKTEISSLPGWLNVVEIQHKINFVPLVSLGSF